MNTWMNNPQYLAQIGHTLGGICLIETAIIFSKNPDWVYGVFCAGVVAAAIKEFWYDMKYELPKQTWGDSEMDFAFYVIGGVLGMCVFALHRVLG